MTGVHMPTVSAPHDDYPVLDGKGLLRYLTNVPALAQRLGGTPADWTAQEVSDGNVNIVFAVRGPGGALCVKQAVPYVRVAGPEWPLTPERVIFEHRALVEHRRHAGPYLPEPLHLDPRLYLLAVEYLDDHTVMRHGLIAGARYPHFAGHIAQYLARTLFYTSDLALKAPRKRMLVAQFDTNTAMCQIMEDMVFTEIYLPHPRNRWTSPELDADVERIRQDTELKLAVSRLKNTYLTVRDALIHGDLHTGSIMVSTDEVHVIDQEFSCYGPMGFDIGNVLAHLLINYFAQGGQPGSDWLLRAIENVWNGFHQGFAALWRAHASGDAYPKDMFATPDANAALEEEREKYLNRLFTETLGFCGAEILRRVIGFARPADFTEIDNPARRAVAERRALRLARDLVVAPRRYQNATHLTAAARRF
ncbi:S-methyl-5-thioribose kinase [Streptomyces sp. NPDC052236]|uniref:S-methyl-5-thioribose kinase n=1 Tax=Streptomyces sp. NPDC052236 TaxID=3365686 RepID=UPI0037D25457